MLARQPGVIRQGARLRGNLRQWRFDGLACGIQTFNSHKSSRLDGDEAAAQGRRRGGSQQGPPRSMGCP
ncbi:hypothetical protein APV28_0614 [Comamonas testosteroni]|nr:hypothetical protein APV28_0614 [Comamonas testosteroni]